MTHEEADEIIMARRKRNDADWIALHPLDTATGPPPRPSDKRVNDDTK